MFFSVIIPTFNDWDQLKECLMALDNQSLDKDKFEIIVANNSPSSPIPEMAFPENAIMINEPKPGSYAARNAALVVAKGEIIAFTDSDCIPDPNWLATAYDIFSIQSDVERIAGKINLTFKSQKNHLWNATKRYMLLIRKIMQGKGLR